MLEILSLSLKMGLHHLYNLSSFVTKKKKLSGAEKIASLML